MTAAEPRWATQRTPSRPTYGPAIGQVAAALGKPLQPWQQQVVDVATELLPDGSWAYRTVVIHVQRQAGKTTLLGPTFLHRCLTREGAKTWLTAQKREAGRDIWRDVAELVRRSPLSEVIPARKSNGSEELMVSGTGSTFRVFAPSEDALHGKANEAVAVDEGWVFDLAEGLQLEQAILPTFSTTGGQLWLPSTAGTAASTWLRSYIDRGRGSVEAGRDTGIAYFEWSLAPDAGDVVAATLAELMRAGGVVDDQLDRRLDEAVELVMAAHPGLYVRRDAVRDAAEKMPPGEFLRAYGNVWTLTSDRVISDHHWRACRAELAAPEPGTIALAFDVAPDRSRSAIGAAWRVGSQAAVDVIDDRPGTGWLVERIEQLAARHRVDLVGYDAVGPALDIADQLQRRGKVKLHKTTLPEYAAACAGYLQAVNDGQLLHRGTPALDDDVAAAAQRWLTDRWVWSRRDSAGTIPGLVATTVALWAVDHKPAPAPAPVIVSRSRGARVLT